MLKHIELRFGASQDHPPLAFAPGPMTVFVGPNNSGKSLALREVEDFIAEGGDTYGHVIRTLEPLLPPADEVEALVRSRAATDQRGVPPGHYRVLRLRSPGEVARRRATDAVEPITEQVVDLAALLDALAHADYATSDDVTRIFELLSLTTLRLDGQTRLALTQPQAAGDLEEQATNHLGALFRDDEARERIRDITAEAFGLYFVIDPSGTHFRVRMAEREPMDDAEEQGGDARARAFHGRAHDIAELSDGIRAFTGLTASVLSADYRIMLVDEPEAFLHPPLTRQLGKRLTQLASERGANVLAATHSPEFVMGCVQSGARINIVRLTYRKGVPGARLLLPHKLETMMRDPLLRSTGVLGALFHEGAVVCEADADRVFYAEINERLLTGGESGADGCVFLNAQNKQTIRRIIRPLREMGLPAAAVVDLDILKGREDFRDLLSAALVPEIFWGPWEDARRAIDQKTSNLEYKDGGLNRLPPALRATGERLLKDLRAYGIFVVPVGELECWLPELEVSGHGPEWLTRMFSSMGTDPSLADYQRPTGGGVWSFMQQLGAWIADPLRKGMSDEQVPLERRLPPPQAEEDAVDDPGDGAAQVLEEATARLA
jgi:hypothetical protein